MTTREAEQPTEATAEETDAPTDVRDQVVRTDAQAGRETMESFFTMFADQGEHGVHEFMEVRIAKVDVEFEMRAGPHKLPFRQRFDASRLTTNQQAELAALLEKCFSPPAGTHAGGTYLGDLSPSLVNYLRIALARLEADAIVRHRTRGPTPRKRGHVRLIPKEPKT